MFSSAKQSQNSAQNWQAGGSLKENERGKGLPVYRNDAFTLQLLASERDSADIVAAADQLQLHDGSTLAHLSGGDVLLDDVLMQQAVDQYSVADEYVVTASDKELQLYSLSGVRGHSLSRCQLTHAVDFLLPIQQWQQKQQLVKSLDRQHQRKNEAVRWAAVGQMRLTLLTVSQNMLVAQQCVDLSELGLQVRKKHDGEGLMAWLRPAAQQFGLVSTVKVISVTSHQYTLTVLTSDAVVHAFDCQHSVVKVLERVELQDGTEWVHAFQCGDGQLVAVFRNLQGRIGWQLGDKEQRVQTDCVLGGKLSSVTMKTGVMVLMSPHSLMVVNVKSGQWSQVSVKRQHQLSWHCTSSSSRNSVTVACQNAGWLTLSVTDIEKLQPVTDYEQLEQAVFYGRWRLQEQPLELASEFDTQRVDDFVRIATQLAAGTSVHMSQSVGTALDGLMRDRMQIVDKLVEMMPDVAELVHIQRQMLALQRLYELHAQQIGRQLAGDTVSGSVEQVIVQFMRTATKQKFKDSYTAVRQFFLAHASQLEPLLQCTDTISKVESVQQCVQVHEYNCMLVVMFAEDMDWCHNKFAAVKLLEHHMQYSAAAMKHLTQFYVEQAVDNGIAMDDDHDVDVRDPQALARSLVSQIVSLARILLVLCDQAVPATEQDAQYLAQRPSAVFVMLQELQLTEHAIRLAEELLMFDQLVKLMHDQSDLIDHYLVQYGQDFAGMLYGWYIREHKYDQLLALSDAHDNMLCAFMKHATMPQVQWLVKAVRQRDYAGAARALDSVAAGTSCDEEQQRLSLAKLCHVAAGDSLVQDVNHWRLQMLSLRSVALERMADEMDMNDDVVLAKFKDGTVQSATEMVDAMTTRTDMMLMALEVAFADSRINNHVNQLLVTKIVRRCVVASVEQVKQIIGDGDVLDSQASMRLHALPLSALINDCRQYGLAVPTWQDFVVGASKDEVRTLHDSPQLQTAYQVIVQSE